MTTDLDIPKPIKKYEEIGHNEEKARKLKVPSTINEVWLCDWTCFYVGKREEYVKVYVYCIMDLYSRQIISFGVSENGEDTSIQIEVLKDAIVERNPLNKIVIHSDNGESFKDEFYRKIINTNLNLMQTFNRVEFACADNSHMESFFATLNKEFYRPSFLKVKPTDSLYKYITPRLTIYNFERLLRKYINFYNNKRVRSGIGYLTSRQFESSVKSYVPIPYRRTILHVDINACFAQYEIMMNPALKDKNLVVIGEEYKRDQIIVCASYNARKYGIGCGDRLKYAKHKCPDLVVRKSKKKVYKNDNVLFDLNTNFIEYIKQRITNYIGVYFIIDITNNKVYYIVLDCDKLKNIEYTEDQDYVRYHFNDYEEITDPKIFWEKLKRSKYNSNRERIYEMYDLHLIEKLQDAVDEINFLFLTDLNLLRIFYFLLLGNLELIFLLIIMLKGLHYQSCIKGEMIAVLSTWGMVMKIN